MSKARSTGNLNNSIVISDTGAITFVSGSTTLATINTTGQISGSTSVKSAATASYADSFTVASTLTAQTLVVQTITSSVSVITGSTNFGTLSSNNHTFTGSINVSGSATFSSSIDGTIINSTSNAFRLSGNNALSLVTLNGQSVVKINAAGFWGTQLVGANDKGILIDNTGQVGIGTNVPTNILHASSSLPRIISDTNTRFAVFNLYYQGAEKGAFYLDNQNKQIIVEANGDNTYEIKFNTAGSERMRVSSAGNVGIGATNITGKLMLYQGTAGNVFQSIVSNQGGSTRVGINLNPSMNESDAATYQAQSAIYATDSSYSANIIFATKVEGAYGNTLTERMRVSSAGDVYIGGTTSLSSGALIIGDNSSTRPLVLRGANGVDGTYSTGIAFYPWNTAEQNLIKTTVSGTATASGFQFMVSNGYGTTGVTESFRINRTSCTVVGSLSKGSGSFRIKHPLASKKNTHQLVHSFIEGPQADLIYRGKVKLVDGKVEVNIDEASGMTEGTFEALCREVQCFTTNETGWDAVRGKVTGNILTIESQNTESTDEISWMVVGERQDEHMFDTEWTDANGKVIVEPLIS